MMVLPPLQSSLLRVLLILIWVLAPDQKFCRFQYFSSLGESSGVGLCNPRAPFRNLQDVGLEWTPLNISIRCQESMLLIRARSLLQPPTGFGWPAIDHGPSTAALQTCYCPRNRISWDHLSSWRPGRQQPASSSCSTTFIYDHSDDLSRRQE